MNVVYLDLGSIKKICHPIAMAFFDNPTDPIPSFEDHDLNLLESSLGQPRQTFGGVDLYKTISDKAGILFYSLAQNHCFKNGNKRIATAALLVFLYINDYWLEAPPVELADWAIKIATAGEKNPPIKIHDLLPSLNEWITKHLVSETTNKADLDKFAGFVVKK